MSSAQIVRESANGTPQLALEELPVPDPQAGQAVVKIEYTAQNPTDGKSNLPFHQSDRLDLIFTVVQSFDSNAFGDGAVLGCDFVGTVQRTGSNVSRLKKGDLVAGLIWGGEVKGLGAYAQHTLVDEKIAFKVPPSVPKEQAATMPLAVATAWLALFSKTSLCIPRNGGEPRHKVLVWGGSSSVGQYAIQLAKLSGIEVITTCSPKHFDHVKRLGASHVADYRSADVVDQIRRVAPDLMYVFDTIGSKDSSRLGSRAVGGAGGTLCTVRPGLANTEETADGVTLTDVLVWTAFLKEHSYGKFYWPASEADHALAAELFEKLPAWLESKSVVPNKAHVLEGLESLPHGFEMHRKQEISGFKVVYHIQ
ncbi:Zinc-binding oxidoreductase alcohol dehydrogenase [Diplodia seriata]|uniref:Zinc-binding oxidoreductase alcohol dehydrogenase n=1 Tax=Diplodia seriata TaxID=420778 RepID=A0ABR3CR00_9PEZI